MKEHYNGYNYTLKKINNKKVKTNNITMPLRKVPGNVKNYSKKGEDLVFPELNFRKKSKSSNLPNTTKYASHAIQKHPATFIPQIPRFLIEKFLEDSNQHVLDCYSGSGKTGVEAILHGHKYTGIEINPLSKLLSKVSTFPIPLEILENFKEKSKNKVKSNTKTFEIGEFPGRTKKEYWFENKVIEELNKLRNVIKNSSFDKLINKSINSKSHKFIKNSSYTLDDINSGLYNILVLAFSGTVSKVSNADSGLSKPYKSKKIKEKLEKGEHPPSVEKTFFKELNEIISDISELWKLTIKNNDYIPKSNIKLADSRDFNLEESADIVITSPPYTTAMNYFRSSKLRLFWIQDLLKFSNDFSINNIRKSIIGSKSSVSLKGNISLPKKVKEKWNSDLDSYHNTRLPRLDDKIESVYNYNINSSERKSYILWKFFAEDIMNNMVQVFNSLKKNSYFMMIVGENNIANELIETHKYIEDIGINLGKFDNELDNNENFNLEFSAFDEIKRRELFNSRNHDQGVINCEWLVCFKR